LTYPFVSAAQNQLFAASKVATVKLANPLQGDADEMRVSILPGLIDAAKRNLSRGMTDLAIFEEGSVFLPSGKVGANPELPAGNSRPSQAQLDQLNATVPAQPHFVAGIFAGNRIAQQVGMKSIESGYTDALHAVRVLAKSVGVEVEFQQAAPVGFHPGRTAEVLAQINGSKTVIGVAGELDPTLATNHDLPRRIGAFEINLEQLFAAAPDVIQAGVLLTMPAATQDLSLVVPVDLAAAKLLDVIREGAGELLERVALVDDYRGSNVAEGYKSLTFALRFRAADRTLTQVEASAARDAAVELANQRFGATLRA
jgi:phenylalanyl-tRNA synthetase beta chain